MIVNAATLQALFTSLKTSFQGGFNAAESQWEQVATMIPSASSRNDYSWLAKFPRLKEWIGDKQIENLKAHHYQLLNKDFEATVEVDRNDIEDDNLGVYAPQAEMAGYSAKTFPDEYVFPLLSAGFSAKCYDGKNFFATDHKVGKQTVSNHGGGSGTPWYLLDTTKPIKPLIYQRRKKPLFVRQDDPQAESVFLRKKFLYGVEARANFGYGLWQMAYGSKDTLDATNYAAARAAMMAVPDEHGRPLNIRPNLLVVPPTLESAARQLLLTQMYYDTGSSQWVENPWYNTASLLVAPWLA